MRVESDLSVDVLMRRWPASIRLFIDHRMLCVGCPIAGLHTIEDACREHDVPISGFMSAVEAIVEEKTAP